MASDHEGTRDYRESMHSIKYGFTYDRESLLPSTIPGTIPSHTLGPTRSLDNIELVALVGLVCVSGNHRANVLRGTSTVTRAVIGHLSHTTRPESGSFLYFLN